MRIRGWFLEGFGVFRDYEVRELGDGLTVFLGPNDAGKTTLLAFVRGALFGFPDGRSKESRYPPLRGGRHLGRLFLVDDDGDYALEREAGGRHPPRVVLPDGSAGGETDLRRLLGGADQRLFRSVFAFSLTELQSFKSLTDEGVRDRIFSAGIAGAGRSAGEAITELDAQAARLLKQGAGRGRINELERDLLALEAEIVETRRAALDYGGLLAREHKAGDEVVELTGRVQALAGEIRRSETLVELWPAWNERVEAEAALAQLESVDAFPDEPESQLAGLLEELRVAERQLEELKAEQESAERTRGELTLDESLAAVAHEVEDLHENLALHRDRLAKLPGARVALAQTKELVEEILRELGPGWDEERLAGFDRSIPRREEVRAWEQRLRASEARRWQPLRAILLAPRRRSAKPSDYATGSRQACPKKSHPKARPWTRRSRCLPACARPSPTSTARR